MAVCHIIAWHKEQSSGSMWPAEDRASVIFHWEHLCLYWCFWAPRPGASSTAGTPIRPAAGACPRHISRGRFSGCLLHLKAFKILYCYLYFCSLVTLSFPEAVRRLRHQRAEKIDFSNKITKRVFSLHRKCAIWKEREINLFTILETWNLQLQTGTTQFLQSKQVWNTEEKNQKCLWCETCLSLLSADVSCHERLSFMCDSVNYCTSE